MLRPRMFVMHQAQDMLMVIHSILLQETLSCFWIILEYFAIKGSNSVFYVLYIRYLVVRFNIMFLQLYACKVTANLYRLYRLQWYCFIKHWNGTSLWLDTLLNRTVPHMHIWFYLVRLDISPNRTILISSNSVRI